MDLSARASATGGRLRVGPLTPPLDERLVMRCRYTLRTIHVVEKRDALASQAKVRNESAVGKHPLLAIKPNLALSGYVAIHNRLRQFRP